MLKAISLYTGAGGLDFGFEAAGFKHTRTLDFLEENYFIEFRLPPTD